jgi:hypothetical protein
MSHLATDSQDVAGGEGGVRATNKTTEVHHVLLRLVAEDAVAVSSHQLVLPRTTTPGTGEASCFKLRW